MLCRCFDCHGSYFMALFMRFDFRIDMIPEEYMAGYLWSMPFWIVSTIVVYYIYKLYHSIWAFVSITELKRITMADLVLIPVYMVGSWFMELHMLRLSGYKPDEDIKIEYTGLRDIIGTTKKNLCFSMV